MRLPRRKMTLDVPRIIARSDCGLLRRAPGAGGPSAGRLVHKAGAPTFRGQSPLSIAAAMERVGVRPSLRGPDRGDDVSLREVVAFEEKRLVQCLGKRVGEAVAEVQLGRVAAAFAE